jgi:integrase
MMLAKLGLRADEVATLTLDDVDWRKTVMGRGGGTTPS